MFLSWNEIKRNKLKFSLIIGVLVMISYLLFFLSGLANGLMNMNREAVDLWKADAIVLKEDADQSLDQSTLKKSDVKDKFDKQAPLAATSVIASNGNKKENARIFGIEKNSFLLPELQKGRKFKESNEVVADKTLKDKGFKVNDELTLSTSDEKLKIVGFTESSKFNASPVIYSNFETIEKINPMYKGGTINGVVVKDDNYKKIDLKDELKAYDINKFIENLPGYNAQNTTLNFMIIFLFVISAMVIGIFLYIITLQKKSLFGILKAQGFTNGFLARSVIAQTIIISVIGTAIGLALTLITGLFLPEQVPVKFDYPVMALYALVLITVAILGSLFSVFNIRKIDPLKVIE